MLLAGDLGATNTRLGLFKRSTPRPTEIVTRDFQTNDYPGLGAMIEEFLIGSGTSADDIEAACVGVAGPVIDQRVYPTNINWMVDGAEVIRQTGRALALSAQRRRGDGLRRGRARAQTSCASCRKARAIRRATARC